LGLGDDNRRIRIWFQGSNITKRKQANISGYIEPLQNGLNIEGGFIRIKNIDGEDLGEVQLKQGLRFVFPKLSLQAESLNEFQFEVLDSDEKQIAVLNRSIAHAADSKETVGSTLSTSVLPKPIILEGTDGDRLVRQVLLEEGASLPATAKFTFAVNDPSGRIRLPIFQESRIIKELQADVGKIVVGTPVQIEIGCDEQVNIQVKFSIGQKQFGGTIAPPPPDAVPTEYEIRQITNDFNDAIKPLDDEDMLRLQSLYKRTYEDMVEARSGADYPKVIQKAKELEGLVRQARIAAPLKPPLDTLEKNYAKCIDLISNTDDLKSKVNIKLLRENLDEAVTVGRKAYKIRERESYNDAVQVINTSLQFLINLRRTQGANIKDMDSAMQALMLLDECRGMARFLSVHCLIHRQTGYLQDTKAKLDELNVLEKSVESDSVRVINRCQVLVTEMRRIYKEITPDDRMAKELGGLLNVDSATRSLNIGKTKGFANEL